MALSVETVLERATINQLRVQLYIVPLKKNEDNL